ncbi:MAG: hypothetical protein ACK5MY_03825 [Jhaorihella sp.]
MLELSDTPLLRWLGHGAWLGLVALVPVGLIPFLMAGQAHSDGAAAAVVLMVVGFECLCLSWWWKTRPNAGPGGAISPWRR